MERDSEGVRRHDVVGDKTAQHQGELTTMNSAVEVAHFMEELMKETEVGKQVTRTWEPAWEASNSLPNHLSSRTRKKAPRASREDY